MKTRFVHLRQTNPKTGQYSQNGGITFYGKFDDTTSSWTVAASACYSHDRFVRKEGNKIALDRFLRGETIEIPVDICQGLWMAIMEHEGPVSVHSGVNSMFKATRSRFLKEYY